MAEVFSARAVTGARAGQRVAIKRLLPQLATDPVQVERFTAELDLAKFLKHPNVVAQLEVGIEGADYFMVMELVEGRDLGEILRRCRPKGIRLPVDVSLHVMRQVLDALDAAHKATGPSGRPLGIVHSDVSPSNVLISREGDVKLGDFGVARARLMPSVPLSQVGKLTYVSPELLAGLISTAADLWAANVMLYELLTLERPFDGATPEALAGAIRARRFVPVHHRAKDVSRELALLVERNFGPRAQRFQTAAQFSKALRSLYDERVGTSLAIASVVRGLFSRRSP